MPVTPHHDCQHHCISAPGICNTQTWSNKHIYKFLRSSWSSRDLEIAEKGGNTPGQQGREPQTHRSPPATANSDGKDTATLCSQICRKISVGGDLQRLFGPTTKLDPALWSGHGQALTTAGSPATLPGNLGCRQGGTAPCLPASQPPTGAAQPPGSRCCPCCCSTGR